MFTFVPKSTVYICYFKSFFIQYICEINFVTMPNEIIFLVSFLLFIGLILALDLGVFAKKTGNISLKQAGFMSFFMIFISVVFYFTLVSYGHLLHGINSMEKLQYIINKNSHPVDVIPNNLEHSIQLYNMNLGLEYMTGYIVEKALSVDNIFVIVLIFTAFNVEKENYHRVLFWGVLGAIVMRFIFIFIGAALITKFSWIMYIFGGFLIFTGVKMFMPEDEEKIDTENHPVVKFANRFFKVHNQFVGNKFFVTIEGVKKITPLFLVLIIIEFTDLIFAVDSIPAIFSVTKDPYIVFFSNIFAILGLRSMFFLLAGIIDKFKYLKIGLAFLLVFIGLKMILHSYLNEWGFTTSHSLMIILGILSVSIFASLLFPDKKSK